MNAQYRVAVLAALGLLLVGIGSGAAKSDEETIRELDEQWSKTAQNKDAEKFAGFYAEMGSALPFNAPIATGRAKVKELWTGLMAKPGFALHFEPTSIVVSKAKDTAYDLGTFELKLNDANGASMTIPGKYVVVWVKQNNGEWKAQVDCFNTDK
jgi:uncharacterized protein (TIGR02246 family)